MLERDKHVEAAQSHARDALDTAAAQGRFWTGDGDGDGGQAALQTGGFPISEPNMHGMYVGGGQRLGSAGRRAVAAVGVAMQVKVQTL